MICALNNPSTSLSYEVLERLLEQSRHCPSTLYLAYKVTLLHDEPDLGKLTGRADKMVINNKQVQVSWKHYSN